MTCVRERENMLNDAEMLMIEACGLIRSAGAGTSVELISSKIISSIEHLISGDEVSISYLMKNILHADDGLSWTMPLVSVKHADRRDI